jgi:F-type H+-transporting ATPase subunit b
MHHALLLAAENDEPSGLELILPDPVELLWGAISFTLVALVLIKVAWPRIREAVERREREIHGSLEEAEAAKAEAQQRKEEYEKQIADARGEANRIIEDARRQAEEVRKDLVAKAEKEAEGIVARAQEQIAAERDRAVQDLQGEIAEMSITLAEKVVGRSLDGEAQKELVDSYIKDVAGMGGNGSGAS